MKNKYYDWDRSSEVAPHKVNFNSYSLLMNNIEEVQIKMMITENHCGDTCQKDCKRFHFSPTHYLCLDGMPLARLVGVSEMNHIIDTLDEYNDEEHEIKRQEGWREISEGDFRNTWTQSLPVKVEEELDKLSDDLYIDKRMQSFDADIRHLMGQEEE